MSFAISPRVALRNIRSIAPRACHSCHMSSIAGPSSRLYDLSRPFSSLVRPASSRSSPAYPLFPSLFPQSSRSLSSKTSPSPQPSQQYSTATANAIPSNFPEATVAPSRTGEKPTTIPRSLPTWLLGCSTLVFGIIIIGGLTRLTESGLSITEWEPITGILPPITAAEWDVEWEKYRLSPEGIM
jgi:hypothetical protein